MSIDTDKWFFEHFDSEGTAFGLRVKRKLERVESPYQVVEIWDTETFGYLMTIDGATMLTSRDNFLYHEMMSHPVLFTHTLPREVAIIGGGDCGTLREVLRHSTVESAWQIDIDEVVTRLSEKYFPELCEANGDKRAHLLFEDGVAWMKNRDDASLDVIIVDSTDPVGPAEGLFQTDFFRECHRVLRDGGIIVQQSESPLLHTDTIIRDLHRNMREAGFEDTRTLPFPQPIYPSGWWSCTMAGKRKELDHFREQDVLDSDMPTRYYSTAIHHGALNLPPFMAEALKQD